jgi:type IV pilus assembly protein PilB
MSALIDTLVKEGLISQEQLSDARAKYRGAKKPIQDLLVEMGFIKEEDLLKVSARVFNMPVWDKAKETIDAALTKILPYDLAKRCGVFPIRTDADTLIVAMSDPQDIMALDDIKLATNLKIKPVLSTKSEIDKNIDKYYQSTETVYDILKNINEDVKVDLVREVQTEQGVLDARISRMESAPVVRLCNLIISDAVRARASDIHIEPQEDNINVRYRIDGDLRSVMKVPASLHAALAARIKVLAGLDIAENRKPQDGRVKLVVNDRKINLRISTIPMFYGEKVEIRILDPKESRVKLDEIGFREAELGIFTEAVTKPQGIILVTGPTGSGKTTTLYAALNFIKSEKKNIMTIEDPIEYLIDGINQMQINPVKDVTFATGLRSILRQDPNVILVGEIRDRETADIAFRASLTGHLVFSTLHTNNAVSSITRLLDIGLEPYLIASSLVIVVAQRLVKIICPHCKQEDSPSAHLKENFKRYIEQLKIEKFYAGRGCQECGFSGYLGRAAIFEILQFNEATRQLIVNRASEGQIIQKAKDSGLKTLIETGTDKVAQGLTTLEEIARVVGVKEEDKLIQKSAATGQNIKILIADDDEDILKVVEKRLSSCGYEVVKARDGIEALEAAHKQEPDLIITDVTMPKMNGFELVKELRSQLQTAVIPVVMLTARQDKDSELKGLDAGADDYIMKPFDSDKLLARVKMLLRRR